MPLQRLGWSPQGHPLLFQLSAPICSEVQLIKALTSNSLCPWCHSVYGTHSARRAITIVCIMPLPEQSAKSMAVCSSYLLKSKSIHLLQSLPKEWRRRLTSAAGVS